MREYEAEDYVCRNELASSSYFSHSNLADNVVLQGTERKHFAGNWRKLHNVDVHNFMFS
jgi:hypothetical protein